METLITMSHAELNKLQIMERIADCRLTQLQATELLSMSIRQVKRLYAVYKQYGAAGLTL